MTASRVAVIGVGNEFRRDDGVGPAVVAALSERPDEPRLTGVDLVVADGEPTRLVDALAGLDVAVIIDAARCDPPEPGRVHRHVVDGTSLPPSAGSSHGLGVPEAIQLAAVLDRLPERVIVHTVEADELGYGTGLSPAVAAAVPHVADAVLADLRWRVAEPPAVEPGP